jgi:hypothetical protein
MREHRPHDVGQSRRLQMQGIGIGRNSKAFRHADAGGDHPGKARGLAADTRIVGLARTREWYDVAVVGRLTHRVVFSLARTERRHAIRVLRYATFHCTCSAVGTLNELLRANSYF